MVDIVGNVNPTFHVVFRDAVGNPAISGSVETFKASAHGTHKAVYEDRALTTPLSNPIALNAAGIVSRSTIDGTPVPMYLSDDENYYMVVRDSLGNIVQTIDDWNADNAFSTKPKIDEVVTTNFIPNAQYRTLVNGKTLYSNDDLNATNNVLIARDNWYLRRDVLTSTNTIEFKEFIVGQTDVPFNPKYYLNFACSVISTETIKDITVDIGDVETFSNQEMTLAIYAKSSTLSQIEVLADQDFGTGGSTQVITILESFQLTSSWAQYNSTFTAADVGGKTVGTDNKFRFRIRVPLNAICDVDLSNIQLNIGNTVLELDFQPSIMNDGNASKDAIPQPAEDDSYKSLTIDDDNITNVWRSFPPVGSIHWMSIPNVPTGYLKCNGDTYEGYEGADYSRLANLLGGWWGAGDDGFYSFDTSSSFLPITCNKFDTGTTDIADGTTGFTFATEQQGGDKGFNVELTSTGQITVTNKNNGIVTDGAAGTTGFTVTVTQQGTAVLPEITEIDVVAPAAGQYFLISSTTTDYYVWFSVDNIGADPAVGGRTGIKVAVYSGQSTTLYANIIRLALSGCEQSSIVTQDASTLTAGDNFLLYNSATTFVPWYRIDDAGTEPVTAGTKVVIDVASSDLAAVVASKTQQALTNILFKVPDLRGYFIRGWDDSAGIDPDAASRFNTPNLIEIGDNIATSQEDEVGSIDGQSIIWADHGAANLAAGIAESVNAVTTGLETRPKNIYLMPIIKY